MTLCPKSLSVCVCVCERERERERIERKRKRENLVYWETPLPWYQWNWDLTVQWTDAGSWSNLNYIAKQMSTSHLSFTNPRVSFTLVLWSLFFSPLIFSFCLSFPLSSCWHHRHHLLTLFTATPWKMLLTWWESSLNRSWTHEVNSSQLSFPPFTHVTLHTLNDLVIC